MEHHSIFLYNTSQKFEHTYPSERMGKCVQTFDLYCTFLISNSLLYLNNVFNKVWYLVYTLYRSSPTEGSQQDKKEKALSTFSIFKIWCINYTLILPSLFGLLSILVYWYIYFSVILPIFQKSVQSAVGEWAKTTLTTPRF